MLRTRDLLRTRIASYRRLMQSLNDYLVELSDTEELKDAADDGTAAQLVQQLKSAIEKDLSELETKLAKVIESMTKVESMSDSENR
jgi:Mg2+ and Co2+ transporter CorA